MARKKNKTERPLYDRAKLRASFIVYQIIEKEMGNEEIAKESDISYNQVLNIKHSRPVKLEILFKVAKAMKKPVTDFLLK